MLRYLFLNHALVYAVLNSLIHWKFKVYVEIIDILF